MPLIVIRHLWCLLGEERWLKRRVKFDTRCGVLCSHFDKFHATTGDRPLLTYFNFEKLSAALAEAPCFLYARYPKKVMVAMHTIWLLPKTSIMLLHTQQNVQQIELWLYSSSLSKCLKHKTPVPIRTITTDSKVKWYMIFQFETFTTYSMVKKAMLSKAVSQHLPPWGYAAF